MTRGVFAPPAGGALSGSWLVLSVLTEATSEFVNHTTPDTFWVAVCERAKWIVPCRRMCAWVLDEDGSIEVAGRFERGRALGPLPGRHAPPSWLTPVVHQNSATWLADATPEGDAAAWLVGEPRPQVLAAPLVHRGQILGVLLFAIGHIEDGDRDVVRICAAMYAAQVTLAFSLINATKDLARAKLAAEASNHAKSAFLAGMSHELRTPLNAILGYAELLGEGLVEAQDLADLACIRTAGQHLLSLVDEVLDLARVESGDFEAERRTIDVLPMLRELARAVRLRAAERRQQVVVVGADGTIRSDPKRLRQILLNLLGNATKYAVPGTIRLGVAWSGGATLYVEDEGPGMSDAQIAQAFTPFTQLGRTSDGVGLGLSICERLSAALGITLSVQSRVGEGTRFSLQLGDERPAE